MIIVGHLLGFEGDTAKTFEVVIQLGSILAVVVMFWRRLFGLIGIHFGRPLQHEGESKGRLTLIHILLGMIPAVVLGLLFNDTIKSLFNPINVMYALVVGGLLLIAAECLKPKEPRAPGLDDMTYRQAFMIGCFQCLALWPGFSRSGATISGGPLQHEGESKGRLTLIHILLGMIPAVVLGLLFHDTIKSLFNPINVMYALVVGGLLLIAAECLKPKEPRAPGLDDMTYRQAFMIGCFQCLALWPGFSRSGATISGGMLMGVSRYAASEFSFLLAVPMMMGATALDLYKSWGFLTTGDIPMFAVGFITAFVVALIAIKTFLQLIKRISFIPFAIYRFIVAAAVYSISTKAGAS